MYPHLFQVQCDVKFISEVPDSRWRSTCVCTPVTRSTPAMAVHWSRLTARATSSWAAVLTRPTCSRGTPGKSHGPSSIGRRCSCLSYFMTYRWFCRRKHKKGLEEETAKKRNKRTTKFQRAVVGATLQDIMAKRNQKPEVRKAQREQAVRAAKESKKTTKVFWVSFLCLLTWRTYSHPPGPKRLHPRMLRHRRPTRKHRRTWSLPPPESEESDKHCGLLSSDTPGAGWNIACKLCFLVLPRAFFGKESLTWYQAKV